MEPLLNIEQISLLGPKQSGKCLTLNRFFIRCGFTWMNVVVKLVCFASAQSNDGIDFVECSGFCIGRQSQTYND